MPDPKRIVHYTRKATFHGEYDHEVRDGDELFYSYITEHMVSGPWIQARLGKETNSAQGKEFPMECEIPD